MYARSVNDRPLTFQVSGMLWNRSLVMRDLETETLWSHILGRGMRGELEGTQLETLPALMTDWKSWKTRHPDTKVVILSRTAEKFRREIYDRPEQFALGLVYGGRPYDWPFDGLLRHPVVNDELSGTPVLIVYLASSGAGQGYLRTIDNRELSFHNVEGRLEDRQTGSRWDPVTGAAIDGLLKGSRLDPLPTIISFRASWRRFHPNTTTWTAQSSEVTRRAK